MTVQRQGVAISTCVCAKDILEKWDKLCEMKEESEKVVVGSGFLPKKQKQRTHLMTLMLALESLFFLYLGVSSEWQVEHLLLLLYLPWNHNSNT